jgi:DNA-binding transcriptional LysR family regulator
MDLQAVRTFVAAADMGQFQGAADNLEVTQQAVSKRIATLEKELGVRLFTRTARGARLTVDGQAFLPHARALLQAAERAGRRGPAGPAPAARGRAGPQARPGPTAARVPRRAAGHRA